MCLSSDSTVHIWSHCSTRDAEDNLVRANYEAPSEPPPLLNFDQVRHLAYHGWLPFNLAEHFNNDLQHLWPESQAFFRQTVETKAELYPSSRGTECGYYSVPDEKEYVTFRYRAAFETALEQRIQNVWHQAAQLLYRVLCDLSRAGSYDVHAWDHLVHRSLSLPSNDRELETVPSLLRLFKYYPDAGVAEEHVDIGLLTLCASNQRGLQVLDRESKEYVDAVGPVILIGDMARALLKNRVQAGLHRVISNANGRHSVVFALRPNLAHETNLASFGGHGTVNTRDFFYNIKGRKYNINATKDIREKQRQEQKRRGAALSASSPGTAQMLSAQQGAKDAKKEKTSFR